MKLIQRESSKAVMKMPMSEFVLIVVGVGMFVIIRWTEEETKRHDGKMKLLDHQENGIVTSFPIQDDNVGALMAAAS